MAEPLKYSDRDAAQASRPCIYVCVTCRKAEGIDGPMGANLHDALLASAEGHNVDVRKVECLSACSSGCTAVVSMPGKWTWLLGRLTPEKSDDILEYLKLYEASRTGTVMPSKRPASLSDMVLGRIPASLIALQEPS
ncbi:DUF1636 domain-containing protein [Gluconobacter wancherniae]|uniref:DUF1636 domain-containing protein n=1 Tax=Gluconobacter wancherniae TaxID=1307955 RepID=UPI0030B2C899